MPESYRLQTSDGRLQIQRLTPALDRLYTDFQSADSATDPIQIVRRFARDDDREIVGFIAAALAFGRVSSVLQSIERVLAVIGPPPAAMSAVSILAARRAAFAGIVHRWTRGATSSPCCGCCGRWSTARDRWKDSFSTATTPARTISPTRSTASRRGRWRLT